MNPAPKATSSKAVPFVMTLLFLGCAGLGYWAAHLWRDLVKAETEVAQLRAHVTQVAPAEALQVRNDALSARVADLEKQLAAALPPAPVPAPAEPAKPRSMVALAAEMMNSPGIRDTLARVQKTALERKFADLMNQLGLSPDDRARFIGLLVEKQMNMNQMGVKMMSGTPEERAAAAEVTALNTSLTTFGQAMSPEQSNALAGLMTETRRDFALTHDLSDPSSTDPQAALNGPAMEAYFQQQVQLQGQIADRAAAFLSPEQVSALRQAQAMRMDTMKNSLNMARQMMGGGK